MTHSLFAAIRLATLLCALLLLRPAPPAGAQPAPLLPSLPPESVPATPVQRRAGAPARSQPLVVVMLLGGVTWEEWAAMATPSRRTPHLRRVLGQGVQGALALPAHGPSQSAVEALAVQLSAGRTFRTAMESDGPGICYSIRPREGHGQTGAAGIFHSGEAWRTEGEGRESGSAGDIFLRRTLRPAPAGNLLAPEVAPLLSQLPQLGNLAAELRLQGRRAVAIGNADVVAGNANPAPGARLREWGLLSVDPTGLVSGGEVSPYLLRRDARAPFGLRQDHIKTMEAVLRARRAPDVGLIALEWGDTRRAELAAVGALPRVAAAQKELALRRADFILKALLPRIRPGDRLVLVAVPQLNSSRQQLLPVALWSPATRGGLLAGGPGNVGPGITLPHFYQQLRGFYRGEAFPVRSGSTTAPEGRLASFLAVQAGTEWLNEARQLAHPGWLLVYAAALWASVAALLARRRSRVWVARALWFLAMLGPILGWLVGVCLELTRRSALAPGAGLPLVLLAFALLILLTFGLLRSCFWPRFKPVMAGGALAIFTLAGTLAGGFALPWNTLLQAGDPGPDLVGVPNLWGLWLLGATLAGIGALAQPGYSRALQGQGQGQPRVLNIRPVAWWLLAVLLLCGLPWLGASSLLTWLVAWCGGFLFLKLWAARTSFPAAWQKFRNPLRLAYLTLGLLPLTWLYGTATLAPSPLWWLGLSQVLLVSGVLTMLLAGEVRPYLWGRFPERSALTALCVAAVPAVLLFGPAGFTALAFWPLATLCLGLMSAPGTER